MLFFKLIFHIHNANGYHGCYDGRVFNGTQRLQVFNLIISRSVVFKLFSNTVHHTIHDIFTAHFSAFLTIFEEIFFFKSR